MGEIMHSIDISGVADENYIYLTTKGRRTKHPHTVELWFVFSHGKIYLSHEGKYTDWMRNLLKDERVEFRIRDLQFKGRAQMIKKGKAFDIGIHALYLKYYGKASEEIINDWFSESTVIEMYIRTKE
jgi:hypothetical protein